MSLKETMADSLKVVKVFAFDFSIEEFVSMKMFPWAQAHAVEVDLAGTGVSL